MGRLSIIVNHTLRWETNSYTKGLLKMKDSSRTNSINEEDLNILQSTKYEVDKINQYQQVLARSPRQSTGIRVASGFEFSVCSPKIF